jgi:hypothetical protein
MGGEAISGREAFEGFLQGRQLARAPFAPLLTATLARVGGATFEALTGDPALWSGCLLKTADLFDLDGVAAGWDSTLLAEACGCTVSWTDFRPVLASRTAGIPEAPEATRRVQAALEAAERTFHVCRSRRACVAVLTGPVMLGSQLFGPDESSAHVPDVKQAVLRVAEAFCRLRPDLLVLREEKPFSDAEVPPGWRRAYGTLRNVASHYNVPLALWVDCFRAAEAERYLAFGPDLLVLGGLEAGAVANPADVPGLAESPSGFGISLPLEEPKTACSWIRQWREFATSGAARFFFTGADEGRALEPDGLHRVVQELRC